MDVRKANASLTVSNSEKVMVELGVVVEATLLVGTVGNAIQKIQF